MLQVKANPWTVLCPFVRTPAELPKVAYLFDAGMAHQVVLESLACHSSCDPEDEDPLCSRILVVVLIARHSLVPYRVLQHLQRPWLRMEVEHH